MFFCGYYEQKHPLHSWTSKSSLPRKLPYPLLLAPSAHEDLTVLFAHDVAVEALEDDLAGIFGVDDAVAAFVKLDVANGTVAIGVFGELVVQRGPVAEVAPAEVGGMGIDQTVGGSGFHNGEVDGDLLALRENTFNVARGGYLIHIGCNPRFILGDTACDRLHVPHEDAGIPEIVTSLHIS